MHPLVLIGLGVAAYGLMCDIIDDMTGTKIYPVEREPEQPRIVVIPVPVPADETQETSDDV